MHQKTILPLIIFFYFFISSCANVADSPNLPISDTALNSSPSVSGEVKKETALNLTAKKVIFKNGLTVLLYENHQLPICAYYTFFEVGGRHEKEGMFGGTHFLEHMMFKKKDFAVTIESSGGSTNAYTSSDFTVYHQEIPVSILPQVIKMEADRMNNLTLIPDQFESERNVILDEKLRDDDQPETKLYHKMMEFAFRNTPYANPVIGTMESIKNITIDSMRKYFKTYYTPNNAVLVIVGDIDTDKTLDLVRASYENIAISPQLKEIKEEMEKDELYQHQWSDNREALLAGNSPTPMFKLVFKGEPVGTRKGMVGDLLAAILGDGQSSYLYQKYVASKKPLLEGVGAHNYTLRKNGIFYIDGQLLDGVSQKEIKRQLLRGMKEMCDSGITERSVQKAKNQYLLNYYGALQTNDGVAHFLGNYESFFEDYNYFKKELEIYNSIGLSEIKGECFNLLANGESIFLSVWQKNKQ
ncbi:MAG: hypothetical protein A2504_15230 [Bdellovibrionales bacterium RIFOXYD12_FULL_39_22]|nr:MAG: hypothetical protein A2385_02660 [Bdellovibrionales bacterium RIFOXYB1_FULL_39_21]OFZ43148.1 MAG: hypothetical protein A2485_11805 [Bdellovibrionales bacterium RIFOXYC12_FULL_39_17]OFZ47886.1 MAG: hypothetical protein A2404_16445 [Bdellovibrionales bacterium RIFOXYC1_FULL_39_130]OFZ74832.1 MAG: hypothetical protein A2451_03265 [Bdellovibrionales bacterium RIFOXYC2_FULL_39_8]OFZ75666.1 MAG: hypothetical protein A2560_12945 [Bdellovibrionales bacterium RIFOXYD1_FULL_39_84]OFZ94156.1 MAG: